MTKSTGHLIRFTGLLIEMFGVWGVYNSTGQKDEAQIQLPGGSVVSWAWMAVALGFVLWLTGTIVVYASRTRRQPRENDENAA
jgi:hypothetical protein